MRRVDAFDASLGVKTSAAAISHLRYLVLPSGERISRSSRSFRHLAKSGCLSAIGPKMSRSGLSSSAPLSSARCSAASTRSIAASMSSGDQSSRRKELPVSQRIGWQIWMSMAALARAIAMYCCARMTT